MLKYVSSSNIVSVNVNIFQKENVKKPQFAIVITLVDWSQNKNESVIQTYTLTSWSYVTRKVNVVLSLKSLEASGLEVHSVLQNFELQVFVFKIVILGKSQLSKFTNLYRGNEKWTMPYKRKSSKCFPNNRTSQML